VPVYVTFRPDDGKRLSCRAGEDRTEYVERETGLRMRVTRQGARSWSVAYYAPSSKATRRFKLGDASRMPLSKAREAARAALHAVEREGLDPAAVRAVDGERQREERRRRLQEQRAARARARGRMTFGALARAYVEHRRTTRSGRFKRPARPNTLVNWRGILRLHVMPLLESRAVETITGDDFRDVLDGAVQAGGPSMGPRVRELLSAIWRWAETRPKDLRHVTLPAVSPLVAALREVGHAEQARERTLTPAEVWRFWRASEGEGTIGAALRLTLLTAARVREATDVRVDELDLAAAVWHLPAERSKGGKARDIPLSPQAVQLLSAALPAAEGGKVFGRCSDLSDVMTRLRAAVGG
jgi:integrase